VNVQGGTRLNLFLFSVGGVRFGCDAEQIEGMSAYGGEEADDLFWFHKEFGYGSREIDYHSPSVVTIRTEDYGVYQIIIDMMEDIIEVTADDICPFPPLMEPFALHRGMWGTVVRGGRMIILLDFQRFLRCKNSVTRRKQ
jgi:hypothetical protein